MTIQHRIQKEQWVWLRHAEFSSIQIRKLAQAPADFIERDSGLLGKDLRAPTNGGHSKSSQPPGRTPLSPAPVRRAPQQWDRTHSVAGAAKSNAEPGVGVLSGGRTGSQGATSPKMGPC